MGDNGQWQNRIVERKVMRIGDLAENKYNPKHHPLLQQERMVAILRKFGVIDGVIAWHSERNGGKLTLFDGNMRRELGPDAEWPVDITDLTDDEVDELVLLYDKIASMAVDDDAAIMALMADMQEDDLTIASMLAEVTGIEQRGQVMDKIEDMLDESMPMAGRILGDRARQVRPVLYVGDLPTFEQAIKKTGVANRGKAIITICEHYLKWA